ncbi:MAG: D-arabinono-1,4-lactone oxidase, partial [SAR324 cluster bacterium]
PSLFPFYGRELYFNMFGRRGFFEYQVLVGHRGAIPFLGDLTGLLLKLKAPSTFVALRMFKGKQALLKFDGDGVALALDMPRTVATTRIMHELNRLMLDHGALPFVVKNSSLTQEVVQGAYPEYALFKEKLREFDPKRLFRSHHTERLGL